MRTILNGVLSLIGSESLTDEEWESMEELDLSEDTAKFTALDDILFAREAVSTIRDRLRYYYLAKGADVAENDEGDSNIFVGAPLE